MRPSPVPFRSPLPLLALALCALAGLGMAAPRSAEARREATEGGLPLRFEENRGQADARARFLSRGPGFTLFLTDEGPVLSLARADGDSHVAATVRMGLHGANLRPAVRPEGARSGASHYFIGSDPEGWRANVPAYPGIRYEAVYPGIDAVYYGREGQLEYDFLVAPGADPDRVRLTFEGAERVELTGAGDLLLHTPAGALRHRRPEVYQVIEGKRRTVEATYVLHQPSPHVSFRLGGYDRSRTLVIDPVLTYATLLGGARADGANAVAVDGSGAAYVTGFTTSADFPTTTGAFDRTRNDANVDHFDVFVTKLGADGRTAVYSTYLGGSERDSGVGIAVDDDGSAYVTGNTRSTDFPTTANALDPANSTTSGKVFVTKLSPQGDALTFSTYLPSLVAAGGDTVGGIAVDDQEEVYVTGASVTEDGADFDVFIRKLNADGSDLDYDRTFGGEDPDGGMRVVVDESRNAYVTGFTRSADFPVTPGAFDETFGGGAPDPSTGLFPPDAFLLRLNTSGAAADYATYLGGAGADSGNAVAVDGAGRAYITGVTSSADFPTTLGAGDRTLNGAEAFVAQFNDSGSALTYSTYLGGSSDDAGTGIVLDTQGNAYVAGWTRSRDFPVTTDAFQPVRVDAGGALDAFVVGVTPGGASLLFGSYLGGDGDDLAYDLAQGSTGDLYAAGITGALRFPTTPFAFQVAGTSGGNAFAVRVTGGAPVAVPAAPTALEAETASATTARLEWVDNAVDEDGFEIVRFAVSDNTWSLRGRVGEGTTTFTDTGLEAGRSYTYIVRAYRGNVASPWSPTATLRAPDGPPEAPSDLAVDAVSDRLVRLVWTDNSTAEDGFRVQRRNGTTGEFATIATLSANVRTYTDRLVVPNTTYSYRVIAFSEAGESNPSNVVTATTLPPPPPAAPTQLAGRAVSPAQVDLTWQDNSLNETGFEIQRQKQGVNEAFRVIATTDPNDEAYSDTTVEAGTTYIYRVRAVGAGGFSLFTNPDVVQTPGGDTAPSGLTVVPVSNTEIRLAWQGNPEDAVNIRVERSTNGTGFTQVAAIGGDETTYLDTRLIPATRYYYRVRAETPRGLTGYSNVANTRTLAGTLAAPANLTATPESSRSIRLRWQDRSNNETGFRIERAPVGGSFVVAGNVPANTSAFVDQGLTPSTTYRYRVAAVQDEGTSGFSNEARAVTLPELSAFDILPARVRGGRATTGVVQITGLAPTGGFRVRISNSSRFARPPSSVLIPAGRAMVRFRIPTRGTRRTRRARIAATAGNQRFTKRLTIQRR